MTVYTAQKIIKHY